jgi:predicted MFS family arabinose efflux permease
MWMPALQVFQMESVDPAWHSVAYGAVSTAMGLGFGAASSSGGYLIASTGYKSLYLAATAVTALSLVVLAGMLRWHKKNTSP